MRISDYDFIFTDLYHKYSLVTLNIKQTNFNRSERYDYIFSVKEQFISFRLYTVSRKLSRVSTSVDSRGSLELDVRTQFEDPVRSSHGPQHPETAGSETPDHVYELIDANVVLNELDGCREGSDQCIAGHHTDDDGQYERPVDVFRESRVCQATLPGKTQISNKKAVCGTMTGVEDTGKTDV